MVRVRMKLLLRHRKLLNLHNLCDKWRAKHYPTADEKTTTDVYIHANIMTKSMCWQKNVIIRQANALETHESSMSNKVSGNAGMWACQIVLTLSKAFSSDTLKTWVLLLMCGSNYFVWVFTELCGCHTKQCGEVRIGRLILDGCFVGVKHRI